MKNLISILVLFFSFSPLAKDFCEVYPEASSCETNSQSMTLSEIDALMTQLSSCWVPRLGASMEDRRGDSMEDSWFVKLNMKLQRNGRIYENTLQIVDTNIPDGPIHESAIHTFSNPACIPLKLPEKKYNSWKDLTVTFGPTMMKENISAEKKDSREIYAEIKKDFCEMNPDASTCSTKESDEMKENISAEKKDFCEIYLDSPLCSTSSTKADDLKDRAVFCYDENKRFKPRSKTFYDLVAVAFGIEFVSENEAIIYHEGNYYPRRSERTYYLARPYTVSVSDLNGEEIFFIDRQNLEITYMRMYGQKNSWKNYHCEITHPQELLKLFDDRFKKFKTNLL